MKVLFKRSIPHAIAVLGFFLITFAYFYPNFQGKVLNAHDNFTSAGNSKELIDHMKIYDEQPFWTNNLFSGMPAYHISTISYANLIRYVYNSTTLGMKPVHNFFLYMVGFYILLLVLGLNTWQSAIGAVCFGLSTYFVIIIGAGHNTKAAAIVYMAPIIAGIILTFRKRYLLGAAITAFFLAMELQTNHLQITYYLLIMLLIYGGLKIYEIIRDKEFLHFGKVAGYLAVAGILAIGANSTRLMLSIEYSKHSTRGQSELTDNSGNQTSGLDKNYVTGWSYGVAETFTFLIPDFAGGKSGGSLDTDSETYQELRRRNVPNAKDIIRQVPLYWGGQPSQSGPVYVGAFVCFLFVLGLFLVKGTMKWWLLIVTVLGISLAMGKYFMTLTDFWLDYVPLYNKFRSVTMAHVMAEFAMPLLGLLALKEIVSGKLQEKKVMNALKIALGITGGICVVFMIMPGAFFDFSSPSDSRLLESGWPQFLLDAIIMDRESILQKDALRSFTVIAVAAGLMMLFVKGKIKENVFYLTLMVLVLTDMVPVNKRYVSNDNFKRAKVKTISMQPTGADISILQQEFTGNEGAEALYADLVARAKEERKSAKRGKRNLSQEDMLDLQFSALNFNSNYRVMNLTVSTFNDASTGYFHKSIGGYHGAKMKRYMELVSYHLGQRNQRVINMLNTKYFIVPGQDKAPTAQQNPGALGNAWFVSNIEYVPNADAENEALGRFDPSITAIVDQRFEPMLANFALDSTDIQGTITMLDYKPNRLEYESDLAKDRLAVFSEIYYEPSWNAYIDGELAEHFRVNYVLRAMVIPAGKHKIEFKFEPVLFGVGEKIALVCSFLVILMFLGVMFKEVKALLPTPVDSQE
jgi:hypothetical protein